MDASTIAAVTCVRMTWLHHVTAISLIDLRASCITALGHKSRRDVLDCWRAEYDRGLGFGSEFHGPGQKTVFT